MTDEELEQKAEEYAKEYYWDGSWCDIDKQRVKSEITSTYKDGYKLGLNEKMLTYSKRDSRLTQQKVTLEKEITHLQKVEEAYNILCKDLAEIKSEFMTCPLDNKEELGRLIDKLNYKI